MEATRPQNAAAAAQPARVIPHGSEAQSRRALPNTSGIASHKPSAYGLPCAICHLYYSADLDECPTCKSKERVAPVVHEASSIATHPIAGMQPVDTDKDLEQEREEVLPQFKSALSSTHADATSAHPLDCKLEKNHAGEPHPAEVCKPCHERLQGRLDVCEAALHMDLKEAAQIIYDAVWADPSDPSKTYRNAASALLTELRKRAGMNGVRGPFHPRAH
jgi:hypothetical protein